MKIQFIKLPGLMLLLLSIVASSCLKDKAYENGTIQSGSGGSGNDVKVVTIGITASDTTNFLQAAYDLTDNDTTVNLVPIELGGLSAASEDIHVTVSEDSGLVIDYNDLNGTDYSEPGANATIVSNVVTIPKGSRTGFLQIKFKPTNLLNGNFAYGFRITSIAEKGYTIGNLNHGIVAIGPKNMYDGIYKVSGEFIHPAFGDQVWDFSKGIKQTFITSGLSSVYASTIKTPAVEFGIELEVTVNPDNTLDEILNQTPTPKPNSDHYDPATKTFYISGSYVGGTGPRVYHAIWTYIGPR